MKSQGITVRLYKLRFWIVWISGSLIPVLILRRVGSNLSLIGIISVENLVGVMPLIPLVCGASVSWLSWNVSLLNLIWHSRASIWGGLLVRGSLLVIVVFVVLC